MGEVLGMRAFSELGRILQIRVPVSGEQLRNSVQRATHFLRGLGRLVCEHDCMAIVSWLLCPLAHKADLMQYRLNEFSFG